MPEAITSSEQIGQITVGTSAVQLTSTNDAVGVIIKSLAANTGKIYIGTTNGVTAANGFELTAGQQINAQILNANALWAISDTAAQKICYIAN
jgi:hypothetical protein